MFRLHIHPVEGKTMNARSTLFAIMVLGAIILGSSAAHTDQVSSQGATNPSLVAQELMSRMAAIIGLHPAPYSTAQTGLILASCRPLGAACDKKSDCCSGKCCTDDFEECEGIGGTCDSWN